MIKLFTIILLLLISVEARENPFFPASGEKDLPNTSNKDLSVASLKRAAISLPSSARIVQKLTVEYKNLDGSIQTKSILLNNSIDWHIPIFISQSMNDIKEVKTQSKKPVKTKKYIHLFSSKNIKFYKDEKELKIDTKDELIRSFLLTKPYRLVLDFKKDVNLKSEEKNFSTQVFKKISLGTHKGYYRAVVTLDGQYKYKKSKQNYGYKIKLL
ncbi:AMIN domain-containing protein [Sulfurimonas sp.]|uniref:AMIN domain-containing protein n=1 Tax=Sulfurimonas sp. TaxID=2022749 RepID=UPI003567E7D8